MCASPSFGPHTGIDSSEWYPMKNLSPIQVFSFHIKNVICAGSTQLHKLVLAYFSRPGKRKKKKSSHVIDTSSNPLGSVVIRPLFQQQAMFIRTTTCTYRTSSSRGPHKVFFSFRLLPRVRRMKFVKIANSHLCVPSWGQEGGEIKNNNNRKNKIK